MYISKLVIEAVIVVYITAFILYMFRLAKGPTVFDRTIVVDALSYDLIVFMALIAFYTGNFYMATPMVLLALWAFALDMYISKLEETGDISD
ncbi:MAG: monovalent cation/H+ antiporter complex subunit F [Desulfurococcaceae archaeon]